jgi:Domain of unknown function (DUF4189)
MHSIRPTSQRVLLAAAMLVGVMAWADLAVADGALAVGEPADVAAEGFAYGFALDQPTTEKANADAMRDCKTPTRGIDPRAQALCKVVQAFKNQCFAVAMDPKDATPGVGWAVEGDKESAARAALAKCVATAGADRRDACGVTHSGCDGNAK